RRPVRRASPACAGDRPRPDARVLPPRAPAHDPRGRFAGAGRVRIAARTRAPATGRRIGVAGAVLCGLALACPAPAAAGPTGLTFVPTTDVVPFHQLNVVLQNGNTAIDGHDAFFRDVQPVPQAEVGLPWRLE